VKVVLGIDAAWTERQPSGVALIRSRRRGWQCVAVAPSYEAFIALAIGTPIDWQVRPRGELPNPPALLAAATALAGGPPDVIAIDMPLSMRAITARRAADDAIASAYGGRGLGAHSPSPERPGPVALAMCRGFGRLGYRVAGTRTRTGTVGALIEVFPHASAIALADADYRVPYKLARIGQYWPEQSGEARRKRLLAQWAALRCALDRDIADVAEHLPAPPRRGTLAELKRHEDAFDALLCAWTGIEYLARRVRPHGDAAGAVWAP
jgi:predicted RNase H-like nuclease